MSRRSRFVLVAAVHLIATMALTLAEFGRAMARFDAGAPAKAIDRTVDAMGSVLRFPVVTAALASGLQFPGWVGWVPFVLNSLLWAALAASGYCVGPSSRPSWTPGPAPRRPPR